MPESPDHSPIKPIITGASPQLFVADIKASCNFFVGKLGFSIVFVYGEPPFYGQVRRDGATLNLRCADRPVIDPERRDRESFLSADMVVNTAVEIEQLFLEFQSAGVAFHQTLERMPWGAKNFIVKDPDGNLLLFAGPAE
jgi:catechol 2,3-dioxygenase-like lactoylglutathione lyase family enzyme